MNRREEIKKENKKAVPLFILLICIGGLVGGIVGGASSMIRLRIDQVFGGRLIVDTAFVIMVAVAILTHIAGWYTYFKCKNRLKGWDEEDEEVPEHIEVGSQYAMWGITVNSIVSFACFAVVASNSMNQIGEDTAKLRFVMIAVVIFVINLFAGVLMQQKFVDLIKEMNPEKRGSVYDVKFTKKWMESCDEAEKMQTYQSAWASYRCMGSLYPFIWLFTYLADLLLDIGIFASVVVAVLWLIQTSIYYYKAIQLSR